MKKLNILAICFTAMCSFTQAQIYQNTTATPPVDGLDINSASCGIGTRPGIQFSDISVPLVGTIADATKITFKLSLNSLWLGDVVTDVVSPSGDGMTLIRRIGAATNTACGLSVDFIPANILSFNAANTTIIDATSIGSNTAAPAGNYAPSLSAAKYPMHNPVNMATFLNGKTLNGSWRLMIYDYGQVQPSNIDSWQIVVAPGALLKSNEGGVYSNDISLTQNPVQDYLNLNVQKDFKNLIFEIYDASGKVVKKENVINSKRDFNIDVRSLTPGIYLLVPIKDGERKQTIKFIKK